MMKSEKKTEKWRIPGKWILIFLLILLAFYGYQNILAENYERQVVSWIGQTEKDRTVSAFTEPDEEAYQKGCEALKEAGYGETGKVWLGKRIRSYGRGTFVFAIGIICIAGLLTELHMEKRRKKTLNNQFAEKDRELEAKLAGRKRISASGPAENGNLYGKYFPSAKDADRGNTSESGGASCDRRE